MTWNIDPVLGHLGPLEIRYYGLFFAIGLLLGARNLPIYFERWGLPKMEGDRLSLWLPIGMIIGAHYVHLTFYEQDGLLDFALPHRGADGEWHVGRFWAIGSGLASHGGGLGAIVTLWIWARRHGRSFWDYVDPAMCAAFWVVPWVRVGNFFNSEIVGRQWDGPWAVRFPRHDCPPPAFDCANVPLRHPSQVYEALIAFSIVGLGVYLQAKWRHKLRKGAIFFILLGTYFLTRFLVEFVKDPQGVDDAWVITMGQALSLPIVAISAYMLLFSKRFNIRTPLGPDEIPAPVPEPAAEGEAAPVRVKKKKKKRKAS